MIRLAIIGCGAIVEELHLPAAALVPEVEVMTLVDPDPKRADQLADRFSIGTTATSLDDVGDDVDAILIATPPHVRPQLCKQAFERGWHVLAEKPLANSLAECREMTDAARRAGRILAAAHVYRFWPSRARLKQALDCDEYGRVLRVTVSQGKPYMWNSVTGYTVRREMVPGGVLINAGIHPLDTLLWWFGDPISFDYKDDSLGGLESNVDLKLRFENEMEVRFHQSRTCQLPHEIVIETETHAIHLPTYDRDAFQVSGMGNETTIACSDHETDGLAAGVLQLRDFAASILEERSPKITGEEGTRVIQLIESCYNAKRCRILPTIAPIPGEVW
jgi:predicted dehydrogenase